MKKTWKRLCTGFLALATVVTALPTTPVHAESKQYWTESKERVGIVEKVMNDGSIGSTFNEGHLTVEGEDAYCIDINTDFRNGYKTRADASTRVGLLSQLKKIVMLGRQAGYFLIVACQRPDAKYFSDGIRDNFNFRVGLGRISELGYGMLFGSDVKKQFFQKRIKGRGYCDVGTSVISEFYTPLVPKGHDFLQTIGFLAQARQDGTATCEAKGDGTD